VIVATQPAVVKTAAVKTLFDYRYLGKARNRQFGQGVEAKPIEAPYLGKPATDAEYLAHVQETTFSADEVRLAREFGLTFDEARDALRDFDAFIESRDLARLAEMYDETDYGMESQEFDEARWTPSPVTESDFVRPAPARHRRVNQAKARRMAVAGR
jgi:hypothetical protein